MAETTLATLQAKPAAQTAAPAQEIGFTTQEGFATLQRMAKMFCCSSLVPDTFRGDANLGNAAIALDMAIRMKANPLAVMQNMYIVYGRPSWSAQFLVATLNKCGRFSALRYEFQGEEGTDSWGCRAVATELATKEKLTGPLVTVGLAKKEGWYDKKDRYGKPASKWPTMTELMLRYRAASWFVRAYAPEIAMGLPEAEEARDMVDVTPIQEETPPAITTDELKKPSRKKAKQEQERTEQPQPEPEPQPSPQAQQEKAYAVHDDFLGDHASPQAQQEKELAPGMVSDDLSSPGECPKEPGCHMLWSHCQSCKMNEGCPAWDN